MLDHDCINFFGEIEATITEAPTYWVVRRYAECEKCGNKFENFDRKIQKKTTAYGCQLESSDWKRLL